MGVAQRWGLITNHLSLPGRQFPSTTCLVGNQGPLGKTAGSPPPSSADDPVIIHSEEDQEGGRRQLLLLLGFPCLPLVYMYLSVFPSSALSQVRLVTGDIPPTGLSSHPVGEEGWSPLGGMGGSPPGIAPPPHRLL